MSQFTGGFYFTLLYAKTRKNMQKVLTVNLLCDNI